MLQPLCQGIQLDYWAFNYIVEEISTAMVYLLGNQEINNQTGSLGIKISIVKLNYWTSTAINSLALWLKPKLLMDKWFKQINKEILLGQNIRAGLSRKAEIRVGGSLGKWNNCITTCCKKKGSQTPRSGLGEHNGCHLSNPSLEKGRSDGDCYFWVSTSANAIASLPTLHNLSEDENWSIDFAS